MLGVGIFWLWSLSLDLRYLLGSMRQSSYSRALMGKKSYSRVLVIKAVLRGAIESVHWSAPSAPGDGRTPGANESREGSPLLGVLWYKQRRS